MPTDSSDRLCRSKKDVGCPLPHDGRCIQALWRRGSAPALFSPHACEQASREGRIRARVIDIAIETNQRATARAGEQIRLIADLRRDPPSAPTGPGSVSSSGKTRLAPDRKSSSRPIPMTRFSRIGAATGDICPWTTAKLYSARRKRACCSPNSRRLESPTGSTPVRRLARSISAVGYATVTSVHRLGLSQGAEIVAARRGHVIDLA